MPPPAERTVQDVILSRLEEIHDAVNDLRSDLNRHNEKLTSLIEWRSGHERWADSQRAIVETHSRKLDEATGAAKAFRWIVGVGIAALGALEAFFHLGGTK